MSTKPHHDPQATKYLGGDKRSYLLSQRETLAGLLAQAIHCTLGLACPTDVTVTPNNCFTRPKGLPRNTGYQSRLKTDEHIDRINF